MRSSDTPRVYIILVNWNRWEDTVECLRSLENLQYSNHSVIVVDNGSEDQSVDEIADRFPEVMIIESATNRGFAGGNNMGIEFALAHGADYVWLLNNDTVVDERALSFLVDRMEKDPEIGICGSKMIYYHQRDTVQVLGGGSYNRWLGLPTNFGEKQPVTGEVDREQIEQKLEFIIGASMLVSREFLKEVGLLSEDYFLYYEEIDWGIRAKGRFRLGFAPESLVFHKEGASIGASNLYKGDKSRRADYYLIKNRFKLTRKFYPWLLPMMYLTTLWSIVNRMRRGQWSRIPMILKLMFTFGRD